MVKCLVKKLNAEVNNSAFPYFTKYGPMPKLAADYINALDALGITITQDEVVALRTLVYRLQDAGLIDSITSLYPFIGSPNVPLIGSKNLTFANPLSLDYNGERLRGIHGFEEMSSVTLSDLIPNATDYGLMLGASLFAQATTSSSVQISYMFTIGASASTEQVQFRFQQSTMGRQQVYINQFDNSLSDIMNVGFSPYLSDNTVKNNFVVAVGMSSSNVSRSYHKTFMRGDTVLTNAKGYDINKEININYFHGTNHILAQGGSYPPVVYTSMAFFDHILTSEEGLKFTGILNTFAKSAGKTI